MKVGLVPNTKTRATKTTNNINNYNNPIQTTNAVKDDAVTGRRDIGNNLYDDPKVKLSDIKAKEVNDVIVDEDTYNRAKSYNEFRDVADAGMVAMATNNALLSNKKAKKGLFQQQDNSIFGNI